MEDYKERMVEEQKELVERYTKLVTFCNSEKYFSLEENERKLLKMQKFGMEIYLQALQERLWGKNEDITTDSSSVMSILANIMFGKVANKDL